MREIRFLIQKKKKINPPIPLIGIGGFIFTYY